MKKIGRHTQFSLFFLAIILVAAPFILIPQKTYAQVQALTADPDPCAAPNGPAGITADAALLTSATANHVVSVPTSDLPSDALLISIRANACAINKATTAVKNKTVGPTIFGIPVPFLSWDAIAKIAMKVIINQLTNSTVNWINNGFNGSPAFITDPGNYFANIANGFAGDFLGVVAGGNLCAPFKPQIVLSLKNYMIGNYNPQCTLTGIGQNLQNFYTNFNEGGWTSWVSMTQNSANNPYGAYITARMQLDQGIAQQTGLAQLEANWNKGFLSTKSCSDGSVVTYNSNNQPVCADGTSDQIVTSTPGSIIEAQLVPILGQGVTDLGLARSFDDVVSALVGALTKKVFISTSGLFTSSGSGSGSYTGSDTGYVSGTGQNFGSSGTSAAASVTCSPDKNAALIGTPVTWTATAPQVDGLSFSYVWTGDEIPTGQTSDSIVQQYTSEGSMSAQVAVTSVQAASGGTPANRQTATIICSPSVLVSKYNPLAVTCSPSVTHAEINTPITWTATITGGSGQFTKIFWSGSQAVAPGTNNVFIFPSYNNIPNPTVAQFSWPWFASAATHGTTIQSFKNNGTGTMTESLQRIYVRDPSGKLGDVSADVTVEDADSELTPVDAKCGSVLIDEPQ